jgi:hypothetical protein
MRIMTSETKPKRQGNWKPGPGRPKGSRNAATLRREAALAAAMNAVAFAGPEASSALGLLQSIYRSPAVPISDRMRAASLAATFETPKSGTVPQAPRGSEGLADRLNEAYRRTGRGPPKETTKRTLSPEDAALLKAMLG